MLVLYNVLLLIGVILGLPFIIPRIILSEKRRQTVLQRLGLTSLPESLSLASDPERIWIHALSVGEVLSAVPLVKEVADRFGKNNVVFSASTKTGFDIANKRLSEDVDAIFFFPYDFIFSIKRVLSKVRPQLVIIVETDIWPNFLAETKARHVPVLLVNARLSEKSFAGYMRLAVFTRSVFSKFSKICAQTPEDARRFKLLGVPPQMVTVTGNIKFDQPAPPMSDEKIGQLRHSMNIQPCQRIIVAGSTHQGEETSLSEALTQIRKVHKNLMMIIAPRDPKCSASVRQLFQSAGFLAVLMSELDHVPRGKRMDVIVIDAIGFLSQLYALADVAFVGGSLIPFGGHNPLEPAVFSKPVLFGPGMTNFTQIANMLLNAGGAIQVADAENFSKAATTLIEDREASRKMGSHALGVFNANRGALEKTLKEIEQHYVGYQRKN